MFMYIEKMPYVAMWLLMLCLPNRIISFSQNEPRRNNCVNSACCTPTNSGSIKCDHRNQTNVVLNRKVFDSPSVEILCDENTQLTFPKGIRRYGGRLTIIIDDPGSTNIGKGTFVNETLDLIFKNCGVLNIDSGAFLGCKINLAVYNCKKVNLAKNAMLNSNTNATFSDIPDLNITKDAIHGKGDIHETRITINNSCVKELSRPAFPCNELTVNNSTIDTILSRAFDQKNASSIELYGSKIGTIESNATDGLLTNEFSMCNNNIGLIKPAAFTASGYARLELVNNSIGVMEYNFVSPTATINELKATGNSIEKFGGFSNNTDVKICHFNSNDIKHRMPESENIPQSCTNNETVKFSMNERIVKSQVTWWPFPSFLFLIIIIIIIKLRLLCKKKKENDDQFCSLVEIHNEIDGEIKTMENGTVRTYFN